jgi:hypothetical protein
VYVFCLFVFYLGLAHIAKKYKYVYKTGNKTINMSFKKKLFSAIMSLGFLIPAFNSNRIIAQTNQDGTMNIGLEQIYSKQNKIKLFFDAGGNRMVFSRINIEDYGNDAILGMLERANEGYYNDNPYYCTFYFDNTIILSTKKKGKVIKTNAVSTFNEKGCPIWAAKLPDGSIDLDSLIICLNTTFPKVMDREVIGYLYNKDLDLVSQLGFMNKLDIGDKVSLIPSITSTEDIIPRTTKLYRMIFDEEAKQEMAKVKWVERPSVNYAQKPSIENTNSPTRQVKPPVQLDQGRVSQTDQFYKYDDQGNQNQNQSQGQDQNQENQEKIFSIGEKVTSQRNLEWMVNSYSIRRVGYDEMWIAQFGQEEFNKLDETSKNQIRVRYVELSVANVAVKGLSSDEQTIWPSDFKCYYPVEISALEDNSISKIINGNTRNEYNVTRNTSAKFSIFFVRESNIQGDLMERSKVPYDIIRIGLDSKNLVELSR